jgi:hypothetical protein
LKLVFKANLLSVPSPCLFLVSNLQSFKAMQKPWDAKQIFYNPCPRCPKSCLIWKCINFVTRVIMPNILRELDGNFIGTPHLWSYI